MLIKSEYPFYSFVDESSLQMNTLTIKALCKDTQCIILNILFDRRDVKTLYSLALTSRSWSNQIKSCNYLEETSISKVTDAVVSYLIEKKIDVNPTFVMHKTIDTFCSKNKTHLIKYLFNVNNTIPTLIDCTHLYAAIRNKSTETVQLLLEEEKISQDNLNQALVEACQFNCYDIVQLLLKDKWVDVSNNQHLVLEHVIRCYHENIAKLIFEYLSDKFKSNAICLAIKFYKKELAEYLFNQMVNQDNFDLKNQDIFFEYACKYGHENIFNMIYNHLFEIGYSKEKTNLAIDMAVKLACENGREKIVDTLLNDIRIDLSNHCLNCSLEKAVENGHANTVEILLKHKNSKPSVYLLRFAVIRNDVNVAKVLLNDKRIDPSAEKNFNVFRAKKLGYHEILKLLVQNKRYNDLAHYSLLKFSLIKTYRFCLEFFGKIKIYIIGCFSK